MAPKRRRTISEKELEKAFNGTEGSKKTSSIWAYIEVIEGGAKCKRCQKHFKYNPSNGHGSSNLNKHLGKCKPKAQRSQAISQPLDPSEIDHMQRMVYGLRSRTLDSLVNPENEHLKVSNAALEWARGDETLSDGSRTALEDLSDGVLVFSASLKKARDSSNISDLQEQELSWSTYKMNVLEYLVEQNPPF